MTNIGVLSADSLRTTNSLRTATLVSIFSAASAGFYGAADVDPSPPVSYFLSAGPLLAVIWWLERDSGRTGVATVHDFGMFASALRYAVWYWHWGGA